MCNKVNAQLLIFKVFSSICEYLFTFMILFGYKEQPELLTLPFLPLWQGT